jgi:hypothetical protein
MPRIVVRHRACAFGCERKPKLRAFERLALAFLVAAQHERFGRWIEVEPDHVPEFLFKLRIESLKVFTRCGFKSFFDQMRCTELAEMPA